MCFVVPSGERALLQYHVGEECDAMLFAVIQDACFFGGAVQETVMVLDGGNGKSAFCQDFCALLFQQGYDWKRRFS